MPFAKSVSIHLNGSKCCKSGSIEHHVACLFQRLDREVLRLLTVITIVFAWYFGDNVVGLRSSIFAAHVVNTPLLLQPDGS